MANISIPRSSVPTANPLLSQNKPAVPVGSMSTPNFQGVKSTYAFMGKKAATPTTGNQDNTLPDKFAAPQQTATYSPQNSGPTSTFAANTGTQGSMNALLKNPPVQPLAVQQNVSNPLPASQPAIQPTTQTVTPTFPQITSNLSTASLTGSPLAGGSARALIGATQNNPLTSGPALDEYNKAVSDLNALKQQYAQFQTGLGSQPGTPFAIRAGEQAQIQQQYNDMLDAAQQRVTQAQQGLNYGLTEQAQQQSGFNQAAGLGIQAQNLLQSGLTSAAGLAKPELGSIGQVPFSPIDQGQGTVLGSTQPGGLSAAGNLLGQFQGSQALGAAGGTGTASVLQSLPQLNAANTAATGIQNQITSFLGQNPDINPANLAASNAIQQWIQGKQLTNPKYQELFDYLTEYANTLAPVLGVGGDPTNMKTQIASSLVNAQASGQSISQVLQALSSLASTKIQNIQSGATGGGVVNPQAPSGGVSFDW